MRCVTLLYLFSIFILNTCLYAEDTNKVKQAMLSVVSIYSAKYTNQEDVDFFLKSETTHGDKGSGVIVSHSGLVVTSAHVVDDGTVIKIMFSDGRIFQADLIAKDSQVDLALLQIKTKLNNFPAISASVNDIEIASRVYAIGNPFGIGLSVTSGIVSALPTGNTFSNIGTLIQTDASVNPGSSGGALINEKGQMIGITTGIYGNVSVGVAFAIPTNVVKLFINRTLKGQKVKKYWLGFSAINVSDDMVDKLGLEAPKGVIITDVYSDGAGEKAGLKVGDVVLKFGNKDISSISQLSFHVAAIDDSEPLKLQILRKGENLSITVNPEIPKENIPSDITLIDFGLFNNVTISNNSNLVAYELNTDASDQSVVIYNLSKGSFLSKLGAKKGDFIVQINDTKIKQVKTMVKYLQDSQELASYSIVLRRKGTDINIIYNSR